MRLMLYNVHLFLLGLFFFAGCVNSRTNANIEKNKFSKVTERGLIGTYQGRLPCTDCDAIVTSLTLDANREYTLKYVYIGKHARPSSKTGTWELKGSELNLEGVDYKYKVESDKLRQLDLSGKEIKGELAERYVLHAAHQQ